MAARIEKLDGTSPWDAGPFQQALTRIAAVLGTDAFASAFEAGRHLPVVALIALTEQITALSFSTPATEQPQPAPPHASLTAREFEVLRLVATGLTNAQVAQRLHVTSRTINAHLTAIYSKLQVASRSGAIRYAFAHQLGQD